MSADSADIPLRVWVLKGGLIGAALMFLGFFGYSFSDSPDPYFDEGKVSLTEFILGAGYLFSLCCIPALPTALLVGLAHRGLCRLFPREHKSIFAATLVGTWTIICFSPFLGYSIYFAEPILWGREAAALIALFGLVPSLAAVVATTVVLRR